MTKWTTTPPTEPGWYWNRRQGIEAHCTRVNWQNGELWVDGIWRLSDKRVSRFEWWPVRIEEPEEEKP